MTDGGSWCGCTCVCSGGGSDAEDDCEGDGCAGSDDDDDDDFVRSCSEGDDIDPLCRGGSVCCCDGVAFALSLSLSGSSLLV